MKVIIAGSRTIPPHVCDELVDMAVRIAVMRGWEIAEVVWGVAKRGVDQAGKRWADRNGVPDKPFPADWDKHGSKTAGFIRNGEMAKYGEALIAITNGSPGTRNMIGHARRLHLPMIVIAVSGLDFWLTESEMGHG
jgi:hypothetical protein